MSVVAESERAEPSVSSGASSSPANSETPRRNFWLLVIYQVVLRVGWIFKTESIVMPVVLDMIGAGAWLRSLLPSLNRFGQTIPPLFFADRLSRLHHKKWSLAVTAAVMGCCFLLLAGFWGDWSSTAVPMWYGWLFLVAYGCFFIATGLNQQTFGTLQGKLIASYQRGKLLVAANLIGVALAVVAVGVLLPLWLESDRGDFRWIFGFTGACFLVSALTMLGVREPADGAPASQQTGLQRVRQAFVFLRRDPHLLRIALVASSLGGSLMLFPHYQAVARVEGELGLEVLVVWLIIQNLGTALFSVPAGSLADRIGNRFVIRVYMFLTLLAPLSCLGLAASGHASAYLYAGVFFFIGLTPVTIKLLTNYTLELTESRRHPFYLSALGLSLGVPTMVFSPLFGMFIDWAGFEVGFVLILLWLAVGWLLTFTIIEPRHGDVGGGQVGG